MVDIDLSNLGYSDRIELSNGRYFKHITVEELKKFGFDNYYTLVFLFCTRPFDLAGVLYQNDVDYETISQYELFNQLFLRYFIIKEDENATKKEKKSAETFLDFINYVFETKNIAPLVMDSESNSIMYVDYVDNKIIIDEELFYEVSEIIKILSDHADKKEERFMTKLTKKMYLENLVDDMETEKDTEKITFFSLITSIVLNTSYNYDTVLRLNLYQFFQLISKSFKRENSQAIKQGIYSGTIDGKKINAKDYNWLL